LIFDVGANIGQYACQIRELGYSGRIVSFEPLSDAYCTLVTRTNDDPNWSADNIALGDFDGKTEINISQRSASSSILDMLPVHVAMAPGTSYVDKEEIAVRKIDSIIDTHYRPGDRLLLKIDAQGYEKAVIDGAIASTDRILGVQMELSLVPLYSGETLLTEMLEHMARLGYTLMALEPGFSDPSTGQLVQVDCVFFRKQP
jgi:FkbM family methyltransferase